MHGFRRTLFLSHLALVALTVLVLGISLRGLALGYFSDQLRTRLINEASKANSTVKRSTTSQDFSVSDKRRREIIRDLMTQASVSKVRIRLVNASGRSYFDSYTEGKEAPELGSDYSDRREIRAALRGETNSIVRGEIRDGSSAMFVAMPIRRWQGFIGCVYVTSPLLTLTPAVLVYARRLLLITLGVFVVAALLSIAIAQRLALPARRIEEAAKRLAAGDMAARVAMHRRFLGRGDEMDRLTREFNAMAAQIEKYDEERRAFLADVSHELRTPLTAIKGSAETLRDGAWQNEKMAPRFAGTIVEQSDRLIRLVGDLLGLARLEKNAQQVDFTTTIDAQSLLQRSADAVSPLFDERGVHLGIDCKIDSLRGNADLLEQLLINLLANAARHSPEGTTTTLSASNGNGVTLQVKDEGKGIAAEHLPKLGQRFYRVEGGRDRESGGSGLGLAICRRIALAHGGRLEIVSEEGEGTVVTVELP